MDNQQQSTLPAIRHTVIYNAPLQKVWDAVATSEGIAAWFMPNDFKPEAGYEFHLNAGPFGMSPCRVTSIDPPHSLSFAWGKDWTLTFELKELEGRTEFTLIHAGWSADGKTEMGEPHSTVRERMNQGWGGLTEALRKYVEA